MLWNIKPKFDARLFLHSDAFFMIMGMNILVSLFQGLLAGFVIDEAHCLRYAVL